MFEETYDADEADAVLAEKDKEITQLKDKLQAAEKQTENLINSASSLMLKQDTANDKLDAEIAELKQKLESVQASMYADVVDANMDNRRLKRALWIARAKRAIEKIAWFKLWNASISTMNPEDGARQEFDKWKKNLGKFMAKAEEYKWTEIVKTLLAVTDASLKHARLGVMDNLAKVNTRPLIRTREEAENY